jgi:hypothetical protein
MKGTAMHTCTRWTTILLAGYVLAGNASAADVGAPILPQDHRNKEHWEIVYEDLNRDLDDDNGPLSAGDSLSGDALFVRFHTRLGDAATMDFDLGGLDISGADLAPYAGVGLRFLVYDQASWRLGAHLQVHYAPGIEVERDGRGIIADRSELDYDLMEVDGGVTLAGKIKIDEQLTIMPYAGPVLSVVNLDGDASASGAEANLDAGEDNVIGALAGLALVLPEGNTLRFEARVFDDVSLSVAAGFVF